MLKELDDYDWAEVFGEGDGGNCTAIIPPNHPCNPEGFNLGTFTREDVESISGMVEGENDGAEWVVYGQLKDGRWFVARGGCDYTGWDCQAGNSGDVAPTKALIEQFGLSENERSRFGLSPLLAKEPAREP